MLSTTVSSRRSNVIADPVDLEILWTRLVAIADEAATTLVRTSFSPIVRESNDFACEIFDAEGHAIAENTIGLPSFNMTMSRTLATVLERRSRHEWEPGDVIMTNDPWLASGHLPDVTILTPIFHRGKLLGWTGSIAHQADIGGIIWSADTASVYEEGIRIPPKLLFKAGRRNEELVDILQANVRLPELVIGDISAQVAAGETAGRRLVEFVEDSDLGDLRSLSAEVRSRADSEMRRVVAQVPDGVYRGSVDLDGIGEDAVHIEATVTIKGSEIDVDYAGTSLEVGRSLNTVFNYTEAYTCYPIKCALDPVTPRNEGSYNSITVRAPLGSVLNPRFPAPVNARQLVGHCLSTALYRALAPVLPRRVIAESGTAPTLRVAISGRRDDETPFTSILFINGGMGARPDRDGLATTCFPSNVICGAMEVIEATAPLRIWRKELLTDSGGPGEFRGGAGQEVLIELVSRRRCTMSLFVEHAVRPAQGLFGGHPGSPSYVEKNGTTAGVAMQGRNRLDPGDKVLVRYPGGGGYGDPTLRRAELVRLDRDNGLISERVAREVHRLHE